MCDLTLAMLVWDRVVGMRRPEYRASVAPSSRDTLVSATLRADPWRHLLLPRMHLRHS